MKTIKTIWQHFLDFFKTSQDTLRKEGAERAKEKFNIIQEDGLTYIVFGHVKVTPKSDGMAAGALLDDLYELREMYTDQYVECEGRI